MSVTKEQKKELKSLGLEKKKKFKPSKYTVIAFLAVVLIIAAFVGVYVIKYATYNGYRQYLTDYEFKEGTDFRAIKDTEANVEGMDLAAENENLKLYVDTAAGNIAVYDKRTKTTTYSNPTGVDEDKIANETNKNYMKSQLIVDFYNTQRMENTFDSYSYGVALEQLSAENIENGVRIIYSLGDKSAATGIVPLTIRKETLDRVIAALDKDGATYVKKKFKARPDDETVLDILESSAKGASQIRRLNEYFEAAGFTAEDYMAEMTEAGLEDEMPISFDIPLDFTIKDDYLEASVYMKGVVENGGGAIHKIQLLSFFGAADKNEQGYMMVPNGSGSLIYFNNGKGKVTAGNDYSENIYGMDPMLADYTVREITESPKLPVFGMFREGSGILATIEDGASLANVTANVAGEVNEYNNVYTTFTLRGDDRLSMFGTTGSEADLPIVEKKFYDSPLVVRYTFLTEENASYSGAANYYRDRLIAEGRLTKKSDNGDIKFYYDVLSGVEKTKFILGHQYRGLMSMTTFSEAEDMAKTLHAVGVKNQVMNLQGWSKGGYYHDVLSRVSVPGKLGGRSGLKSLNEELTSLGGELFIDCAFQRVSLVSSRYSDNNETSRYYGTGYIAEFGLVNPTSLRQTSGLGYEENKFLLVSPKFLVKYTGKFADKAKNLDVSGISLRDLGDELHSDKKRTNIISREAALDVVLSQLQKMKDTGKSIMVNDGNDYSFAYADDIINAPLTDNDYYIIDETIPFYQMLIHGSIDYSGAVINLSNTTDTDAIVLSLIENGASPHFKFTKKNSNELKETGLNRMYSTTFETWKDMAVDIYTRANEVLKTVNGEFITDHRIENGVVVVTYESGKKIYINKTKEEATVDGVKIAPKSYALGG
ncbi:MAG: hypothetical protein IKQ71_11040 [Lachnospiraceae bacterium]|nr:hypothetical protein [Lachnospiraceae bacterium]